jgi:hypothetical protein
MDLIERIKNNFNKGFFNKAMPISGLPDEYPAWTIKKSDWVGVAVPVSKSFAFSERFSNVKIRTAPGTEINGQVYDLLLLTCDDMGLRNEFAVICSQFVQPGAEGKQRKALIDAPETWWENWKFLLGNVNSSHTSYPVLGELTVLEQLVLRGEPAKWTGANRATNDIELPDRSYEVKSTTQRYGYEVTVSSLYQLKKSGETLDLVFCRFEPSALGRSVDELAESLISAGYPEEELEKNLRKQNLERGCTARKLRYKLLEMKVFPVDDEFPAVTLDSFVGGVMPKFVTEFSYTLDLSGVASKNSL